MFPRSRRARDGWFSTLIRRNEKRAPSTELLNENQFLLTIEKERCRSERRQLSFCIVQIDFLNDCTFENSADRLVAPIRRRLRITDEIGVYRGTLAVLLPETIPSQAAKVANDLTDLAAEQKIKVSTEIFVFPEIDHDVPPANVSGNTGVFEMEVNVESENLNSSSNEDTRPGESDIALTTAEPAKPQVSAKVQTVKVRRLNTSEPTPTWKRAIDIFGAGLGLLLLSPLFVLTAILVRSTSKGPAFFKQWREGKDGQLFEIYKFRTMRIGADEEKDRFREFSEQDGPAFKLKNDPRLTGFGKYLRKSCIDELPQLINVLKGEMSLVGPRPLPVDESLNCSPWHRRRLDVLPGMTCIWQIDGGREIAFDDWMRMDLDYVRQRGFWVDIKLIFKTAFVTLLHRGSV